MAPSIKRTTHSILLVFLAISWALNAQEIIEINRLFQEFDSMDSPGAIALVVRDGKTIHLKGYGNANLEYQIPITPETIFHIASVSKQFTAFAILLLEDQHRLSLNDYAVKYLQYLPDCMDSIKIKHLLHHTSGLREIEKLQQIAGITTADQIESSFLYQLIKNQKDLNFQPGDKLEYSNTNYFLLAKIVENITSQKFYTFTSNNIFSPLNMSNTQFYDDCFNVVKNRAYAYGKWDGDLYKGILSYSYVGPTGVLTTGNDMASWLKNFTEFKIGNRELINKMLTAPDTLNSGEPVDYGYGLGVTSYKGLKVVQHSGHDANFRSGFLYFPEQRVGIVILSNYYAISPFTYGDKIADIILGDFITEDNTADSEMDSEEVDITINSNFPRNQLYRFKGNYVCEELAIVYHFEVINEKLMASYWRNDTITFNQINEREFEGNKYWFRRIKFNIERDYIKGFWLSSGNVNNLYFSRIE